MIATCFSPAYEAETPTASMRKLGPVARAAAKAGFARLEDPGTIDPSILRRLHDPIYVDQFLAGRGSLASSQGWPWTPQIRDGVLAIQAGQLRGARNAWENGIAANVAQGFHHAGYHSGGGFCTFNGLALVAQEFPAKNICVLDCDEHGGNGTEEFIARLPNLCQVTIHGSAFGCRGHDRSLLHHLRQLDSFEPYAAALEKAFTQISAWNPDLLIYQAGADPHRDDPLGSVGLTTEGLLERDRRVFEFARRQALPTLFVLAGGYQAPIETQLVPLHLNTFRAAAEVFAA